MGSSSTTAALWHLMSDLEPPVRYRGRFAPTPSGPLHFGSLVAALASYQRARSAAGEWLVRIDDLDPPRELPGAADDILRTLAALGMHWDGPVVYQSRRIARYGAALEQLAAAGLLYGCSCSRRAIADRAQEGIEGPIYPGTCRALGLALIGTAVRLRTDPGKVEFTDLARGAIGQDVASEIGDFVLRRADGVYSYQLANVVDDAELGITEVVRGADLLASTPRQIYLQTLLGYRQPSYCHVPVVENERGEKLSKQTRAPALDVGRPLPQLCAAASFLGFNVGRDSDYDNVEDFWVRLSQQSLETALERR